jgi:hypothetical protein
MSRLYESRTAEKLLCVGNATRDELPPTEAKRHRVNVSSCSPCILIATLTYLMKSDLAMLVTQMRWMPLIEMCLTAANSGCNCPERLFSPAPSPHGTAPSLGIFLRNMSRTPKRKYRTPSSRDDPLHLCFSSGPPLPLDFALKGYKFKLRL